MQAPERRDLRVQPERFPEIRQRVMIGMQFRCDKTKGHRVVSCPFNLPARENTRGVAINQKREHDSGVIGLGSPSRVMGGQQSVDNRFFKNSFRYLPNFFPRPATLTLYIIADVEPVIYRI